MPLTVAIVGRPNVGKSTLFNRLADRRRAIVDNTPGVTRDWSEAESNFGGLPLRIIDTAGFERAAAESLQARMLAQTESAMERADICLFVIDAREGVTPADQIVASALRKIGKPIVVVANKSEGSAAIAGQAEAYGFGFGEPVVLSAEHGLGLPELYDALVPFVQDEMEKPESDETQDRPLRLAIVGRPNVGKSSLLNRLLGQERALTGPEAGITRDAVLAEWQWQGRQILLHDTAGLRKKAKIAADLEKMSVDSTLHAIRFADCVLVVIDATQPLENQDLAIADLIAREGRALLFVFNKWDLLTKPGRALKDFRERVDTLLAQVAGAPILGVSALTGEGMERIMPAVMEAERVWNTRVSTSELNRFLHEALERHPPPAVRGRRIRIRYMTQAKARPPSFLLFGNQLSALPQSYLRYLANAMRTGFGLPGTPLRFSLRASKNPYANE